MQDSIIVYRNPMEKMFWESMSNGGFTTFLLFGAVMGISFCILYFGICKVTGKGKWRNDGGDWILGVSLVLSFILACAAVWKWA
jgi:hypothetical protein